MAQAAEEAQAELFQRHPELADATHLELQEMANALLRNRPGPRPNVGRPAARFRSLRRRI